MDKNTNPFLNSDWLSLQQQYIDALSSLNPQQNKSASSHAGQQGWNEALNHWQKAVEKFMPGEGRSLFDNVLHQARLYYSIAEDFRVMLRDISATDRHTDDWREIMASHLGKMKSEFDFDDQTSKNQGPLASWFRAYPLDGWDKVTCGMAVFPEGPMGNPLEQDIEKLQERLSAIPGIGPTREFQDKIASATRLWKDYQHKYREYHAVLSQLGKLALDRLEQKIIEMADLGKKISSLRHIYNLWIDSNEEVFGRVAFNEDHARLYGELVNAMMRYRLKCNEIRDVVLAAMNMPTGDGMNSVYKKQHQMESSLQQLQTEIEYLRSRLGETTPSDSVTPQKTRNTRKKKPARKPG